MERYGNLYEKVISIDNLRVAAYRASKGKDKLNGVDEWMANLEQNLQVLHERLKNKTYRITGYRKKIVYEPKKRVIFILVDFADRVVQHAIMNVMEPIWMRTLVYNTYSSIKKRGIEACAERVDNIIESFKGIPLFCLQIDITQFYPSIDHDVLKAVIRRKIKDPDLLWMLDTIIDSIDGLPIGNYISQMLANLMLSYMMHEANEVLKVACVEYADDMVFFADSKERLHEILRTFVKPRLADLHLKLKDKWQVFPMGTSRYDKHGRGLDFIGYIFYRKQKLMRKRNKQHFCRKVAYLNKKENITQNTYKQAIAPWLGWAFHSDSKNLLKTIIKPEFYEDIIRLQARHHRGGR